MSNSLVLTGTPKEIKSPRAFKVIATALAAGLPLLRVELSSAEDVCATTTPLAKALALSIGKTHVSSTNAMMRTIASIAPALNLSGATDIDKALVEGWMSFIWASLDLPIQSLSTAAGNDLSDVFHTLNRHLTNQTFLVGNTVTIADISLAVTLHTAVAAALWKPNDNDDNLSRHYQTLIHQEFFITALQTLTLSTSTVIGAPATSTTTISTNTATAITTSTTSSAGVFMNGNAPAVVNNLYRRHRIRIKEVLIHDGTTLIGQTVTVAGWARTTRNANKGQLLFIELNDGSCGTSLQCVLDASSCEGFEECKACGGTGASFQLIGTIVASSGAEQAVELQVTTGKLLGAVYGGNVEGTEIGGMVYPLSKKAHTLEYLREVAHLRPRGRIHAAAMRIRHAMAFATHNFFHNHGFLYIHTPILTCADCEGAGEQFAVTTLLGADHNLPDVKLPVHEPPPPEDPEKKISKSELKRMQKNADKVKVETNKLVEEKIPGAVDYANDFFARRANLTVSGQLNVETHACALSDVYTFGPTFRAENSHTSRHLSEFWMIEPEIAFADLDTDINLAEDYLKYCVQFALDRCAEDLEFFETNPHGEPGLRDRLRNVLDNPFKRLTYTEAIEVLQKAVAEDGAVFEENPVWGIDLPSEHERYLCEIVYKMPVVLTNYPKEIKAFYMKLNEDGKTVAAADILVPKIGEIIGGSQREHRREVLIQRCIDSHVDPKAVWWYLDLRKYGTVPHAGFGLGFERLILFITGLQNIRDVIPFPRWAGNAEF